MSAAVKEALAIVRVMAEPRFKLIDGSRPRGYRGREYGAWNTRRIQIEDSVRDALEAEGAKVRKASDGRTFFTMAGIEAQSTGGLRLAIANWRSQAEVRLKAGGCHAD